MTLTPTRAASVVVQRLTALLDGHTVLRDADGVRVVEGTVRGVPVVAFATDPTVQGGALGEESALAIAWATDVAVQRGVPVVGVWHSGGARLREGVGSLDGVARLFAAQTRASGRVLQVSVVLGPAAGGAAYGPALTDVVVQGPAGPAVRDRPGRRPPRDRRGRHRRAARRARAPTPGSAASPTWTRPPTTRRSTPPAGW